MEAGNDFECGIQQLSYCVDSFPRRYLANGSHSGRLDLMLTTWLFPKLVTGELGWNASYLNTSKRKGNFPLPYVSRDDVGIIMEIESMRVQVGRNVLFAMLCAW